MKQIRIRGRVYSVTPFDRTTATGQLEHGYTLTGVRGAVYVTMRNVNKPHLMFVNAHAIGNTMMKGVWLSDEGGVLKVVQQ